MQVSVVGLVVPSALVPCPLVLVVEPVVQGFMPTHVVVFVVVVVVVSDEPSVPDLVAVVSVFLVSFSDGLGVPVEQVRVPPEVLQLSLPGFL